MTADTSSALFESLHTLIAPGCRVRVPPYVESAQFRVLFKVRPDPAARSCGKGLNHRNTPMFYALPSDYGRAFRAAHLQADGGACYDVNLGADSPSCSCAGNTYRTNQPCKHLTALLALQARGRLDQIAPPPEAPKAPAGSDDCSVSWNTSSALRRGCQ